MNNKKRFKKVFFRSIIIFTLFYLIIGQGFISFKDKVNLSENIGNSGDSITFLLVGLDTNDISQAQGQRTDTMILTHMNFSKAELKMISIPRDTRILKDNGYYDKINHAHAYGGMDLTLKTVNNFLNLDIEHYVKLDYTAVREVVDAIGGVDFYVPHDMNYNDTTAGNEFHVDLKEGQQILDGEHAIQLLRWRQNSDGIGYPEGDVGRVKTQQAFLKELIKQSLSPKNILKLGKFIHIYNYYIDTNIPLNIVLKGAWTAKGIDFDNIKTATIPGEGQYINDISYFIYDPDATRRLIEDYLD